MAWRRTVARRARQQEAEDRQFPHSAFRRRRDRFGLGLYVFLAIVFAIAMPVVLFRTGEQTLGFVVVGALVLAALFAVWLGRAHRSRRRRRAAPPPDGPDAVRWEED